MVIKPFNKPSWACHLMFYNIMRYYGIWLKCRKKSTGRSRNALYKEKIETTRVVQQNKVEKHGICYLSPNLVESD